MFKFILLLFVPVLISGIGYAQGMKIGNTLVVSHPILNKNVNPEAFQTFITNEVLLTLNKKSQATTFHFFRADRGKQKGEFLLVGTTEKIEESKGIYTESPFNLPTSNGSKSVRDFVSNPDAFTEYILLGWEEIKTLPNSGILGIHSIQVKKDRAKEFEEFVVNKLHPAVSQLFPDMQLLYYKAIGGENMGSYITIFTIDSPAARDNYWPGGTSETEILKKTFKPLEGLAKELATYLVEGSYLEPSSGGAAAYWESKLWTDFIHAQHLN